MTIVEDYLKLTAHYKTEYGEKTILLMEVGSFYEVYALINPDGSYTGSNIEDFAKMNDMVIAKKNICVGKLPVAMAGFGTAYSDKYIQRLQEHEYTIVIYNQDINGKNTTRSLAEIISPGTFFPTETEQLSNNVMCIWLHKTNAARKMPAQATIGIANIDIFTGKTALFQFTANYNHSPSTYDELERYISAYRPSECIFIANLPERLMNDIVSFVGLENAKIHKMDTSDNSDTTTTTSETLKKVEKQIYQVEILKRFYPHLSSFHEMFPTHYIAIQSFCYLLDFVYRHSPNLAKKLAEPIFENYTDRLILSNHTLNQLNIIDDTRHTGKLRSVSSLLNHCVTTMGKRQFLYNLHYPITHEPTLQSSYTITEHLIRKGEEGHQFVRTKLGPISDLEKFMRKMVTQKITPKNLSALVDDLTNIEQLNTFTQEDAILSSYLASLTLIGSGDYPIIKTYCQTIMNDISRVFNLEECRHLTDLNSSDSTTIINKGISPLIDDLAKKSMDGREKLEALCHYFSGLVQQYEKTSTKKTPLPSYIKIHETAKNNPSLIGTSRRVGLLKTAIAKEAKAKEAKAKEAKAKDKTVSSTSPTVNLSYYSKYSNTTEEFTLTIDEIEYTTGSGSKTDMVVTSKEIRKMINDTEESRVKLMRETQLLFYNYITEFSKFEKELQKMIHFTTEMDILQCKYYIATKYNYCKPEIQSTNNTSDNASANGCGQNNSFLSFTGIRHPLIEHLQTNELYVTNDMTLGLDTHGILLYGTNAVGKTSFIKSVGIAVVMAQAGLYVPSETFIYKPYQTIFTRILGNDNLFKGLSTFAVEMTELRTILTMANESSLVLGDELCSGTESDSALSIFTAGLEILHKKESTFLFATHFHEIVHYEEITALDKLKMMHMAVHYNKELNTLVYDRKLRDGPGESMYGLEVCKSLNLPEEFLERAHDIRMKYNPNSKNMLALMPTHFNAKKIVSQCEICNKHKASEVHHLQHQKNASPDNNYITNKGKQSFHKNHVANLVNICEHCHKEIHKTNQEHKVVKTTSGYKIVPL
jgi:DNA mismatch repair protein MutS